MSLQSDYSNIRQKKIRIRRIKDNLGHLSIRDFVLNEKISNDKTKKIFKEISTIL